MNSKVRNQKIEKFIKDLSSKDPTPGGGAVAALAGSLAAALVEMVANLTFGKKKYKEVEKSMKQLSIKAKEYKEKLLNLADEDIEAFDQVLEAYRLPKSDGDRAKKVQKAFIQATKVPLTTAEYSAKTLKLAKEVSQKGNKNALSDAKTAIYLSLASISSALENVKVNMEFMTDSKLRKIVKEKASKLQEATK